jgi:hypothetical protein
MVPGPSSDTVRRTELRVLAFLSGARIIGARGSKVMQAFGCSGVGGSDYDPSGQRST